MRTAVATTITLLLAATLGAGFVYSGLYDVSADNPHASATARVLEVVRDRSVARTAAGVKPPELNDPRRVLEGAGQYAAMCSSCHLAPGMKETSLAKGLQPPPPRLHEGRLDPREAFVIIKHGLKMTGMPAWGADHSDADIWSLVAFLNALPGMSGEQYRDIVIGARAVAQLGHQPLQDQAGSAGGNEAEAHHHGGTSGSSSGGSRPG
jgi:mono/diheme cytochrome c family protein